MLKRDKVEKLAAYAVIFAFVVLVLFMCFAMWFNLEVHNSALFGGITTLILREMASLTIGRGEGGTFEGETKIEDNGNGKNADK